MTHVDDGLPRDRSYVLAHLTIDNWSDRNDPEGNRYWTVVKFVRGLSQKDRALLDVTDERRRIYSFGDEGFNNLRAYEWSEFGPGSHFGQDVNYWCELPEIPR